MSLTVRRVVTGHDENGRAIVSIDETFKNVVQTRPGAHAAVIWTSDRRNPVPRRCRRPTAQKQHSARLL